MSGIFGIVQIGSKPGVEAIAAMSSAMIVGDERVSVLAQQGPDAIGVAQRWQYQQLASLSHLRIAADADLCNLESLSKELQKDGERDSHSVAETIGLLYLSRGLEFISLLEGNFALAIWDERHHRLVLGIDRFAAKNLYWSFDGGEFLFASRAGAIRELRNNPELNQDALVQFLLFSAVPAPSSIYRGIERLEPGHILIYERADVRKQCYWDLDYSESDRGDVKAWAEQTREQIRGAVHRSLAGCLPATTGAYLSGGTDSSSVVAFLSQQFAPANTFSIAFDESRYNEIGYARVTARKFNTSHHEYTVKAEDALEAITKIASYYDEPFANSSAIGSYYCALGARRQGMDILLAGDGGDEIFAGNERYATDKRFQLYHRLPQWLRKGIVEPVVRCLPQKGTASLPARYVRRANIPNPRRVISYGIFLSTPAHDVFEPDFLMQAPPEKWLSIAEQHYSRGAGRSELNRMMYTDIKMTLGDNDLRKVSGTAELAGIAVRYPLLDRQLVEFSARIPSRFKLRRFSKRYIFKKAMANILPEAVLHKTKHGFGVPVALWLLENPRLKELTNDILRDRLTRQRGYFRPSFIDGLMNLHGTAHAAYYGEIVWYLVLLELWHRHHLQPARQVSYVK